MINILISILAFLIAIGVLVAFHEYGHFWVARRLGVKVLRYSIGFGKPIWRKLAGPDQIEYVIAAIPLGGYVKMLDERESPVPSAELTRAFNRQPVSSRMAIIAAGPGANFLLAIALFWLMFIVGIEGRVPVIEQPVANTPAAKAGFQARDQIISIATRATPTWDSVAMTLIDSELANSGLVEVVVRTHDDSTAAHRHLKLATQDLGFLQHAENPLASIGLLPWRPVIDPIIGELIAGKPAMEAGLQPGDRIRFADAQPIETWAQWVEYVRARPEQAIDLEIERRGSLLTLQLTPERQATSGIGFIGAADAQSEKIYSGLTTKVRYPLFVAGHQALRKTWEMSLTTLRVLGGLVTGRADLRNISGPITIAHYAGQSARLSLSHFLNFLAIISISLGILNLLPIPILDGGHLLFLGIEAIRRKPLSEAAQAFGMQLGVVALVGLMGLALYNDILRLVG